MKTTERSTTSRRSARARLSMLMSSVALAACGGGGDTADPGAGAPAGTPSPAPLPAPSPSPSPSPSPAPAPAPSPAPSPAPTPAPSPGATAQQCYDLEQRAGKTVDKSFAITLRAADGSVSSRTIRNEHAVTGGSVTFEGHTAIETNITATSRTGNAAAYPYSGRSYELRTGPAQLTYFGDVTDVEVQAGRNRTAIGSTKIVYEPPFVDDSPALGVGQTFTVTTQLVITNTIDGVAQPPIRSTQTHTARFVGVESLTIAAGTFQACKFEQFGGATTTGPFSTQWLLVGNGIELKYIEPAVAGVVGEMTRELESLTIDGRTPN